jgi:hypothetical protein
VVYSNPVSYPDFQCLKIAGITAYLLGSPEVSFRDRVVTERIVDNEKCKNPKLIIIMENQGLVSGLRNKIIVFYQNIFAPADVGTNCRDNLGE